LLALLAIEVRVLEDISYPEAVQTVARSAILGRSAEANFAREP
jgi:hypothetical protein